MLNIILLSFLLLVLLFLFGFQAYELRKVKQYHLDYLLNIGNQASWRHGCLHHVEEMIMISSHILELFTQNFGSKPIADTLSTLEGLSDDLCFLKQKMDTIRRHHT